MATATPSPTISPPEFASDNIDATFHADLDKPEHREKFNMEKNKQGELEKVYYADISNTSIYYDPADYPYGPSSYVPNYEEATKLSYYSHPQSPETVNFSPKATEPATHDPLFIYPTLNFSNLLDIPAYVDSLENLDEINQQSEQKMKSYTKFSTLANTPTPTPQMAYYHYDTSDNSTIIYFHYVYNTSRNNLYKVYDYTTKLLLVFLL